MPTDSSKTTEHCRLVYEGNKDSDIPRNNLRFYTKQAFSVHKRMWLCPQNNSMYEDVLTRMQLNEVRVGMDTEETKAGRSMHASPGKIPELENFELDAVHLNINATLIEHSPQVTLSKKSKEKEKEGGDQSLPVKGKQADISKALNEKLQQKDLENQHIHLLLMFYQELKDVKEMWELKEAKSHIMAEKLKQEEQKNLEVIERFNSVCEDMRVEISIAKSNNERFVKQLKALLEKYERLQRHANTFKEQLLEQHTKKKRYQKTFKKMQQKTEELLMNRTLLEEQKDNILRELSACRKKIQAMEEEHKQCIKMINSAEERSALKAEYGSLSEQLYKTQVENKKLVQAVQSKELEKRRAEKKLQDSQKALKQLYEELDESKIKTESVYLQLESMKKEFKLINSRHKVEILHLKEQQKACIGQFESMKTECKTLNEVVSKQKKDKCMLKEELEHLWKEKVKSEKASKQEGERLREAMGLLEQERNLLLNEMGDLRKDYFSLSDRITQRLRQLDQTDDPMCITKISVQHHRAPNAEKTVAPTTSMNMIEQIRRKQEDEEKGCQRNWASASEVTYDMSTAYVPVTHEMTLERPFNMSTLECS
ncbi:coiled-coil domain-containing protein 110 [Electrophorus electricus]|uniref:coiled-coil domain-containing protein 110 n=1 Tax=Electrophorus electricus TaxID=8005 RepID=UPI0015CFFBDE|nr:coiled-coil domain-containing protein 110 [Electrophorus electricus]